MHLRLLFLAGPTLLLMGTLTGTDVAPPEAPNPFNTSESRAIRDVLQETFHKKTSDKLTLEELQALYRKLWNEDQEKKFFDGNPTDPRWAKARADEEAVEAHNKMVDELVRLGGKPKLGMSDDEVKAAVTERKEWAQRADREQRAAEEARKHEIAHPKGPANPGKSPTTAQPVVMHQCTGPGDLSSDAALIALVKEAAIQPDMTQPERAMVEIMAKELVARRTALKQSGGVPMLVSGGGVELWMRLSPLADDATKVHLALTLINPTGKHIHLDAATVAVTGSAHNPHTVTLDEMLICPPTAAAASDKGLDLVQDDGQQVTVSASTLTATD